MIRKTFCEKLAECRKASGKKMKEICFTMDVMPTAIYRIESGKDNFSIDNALLYLKSIGYGLYIITPTDNFHFENRNVFSTFFKKTRKENGKSQKEFATYIGISYPTITGMEYANKNTTIDSILAYTNKLDYKLEIKQL